MGEMVKLNSPMYMMNGGYSLSLPASRTVRHVAASQTGYGSPESGVARVCRRSANETRPAADERPWPRVIDCLAYGQRSYLER